MITGSSERLDRIIGYVKGNMGRTLSYTLYELMSDCKLVTNVYCLEDNINKTTIIIYNTNIKKEDIKEKIGRGIVHYLYAKETNGEIKCNLTMQDPVSLSRDECIKIADITLKELKKIGIIEIGEDYIIILKNLDDIAKDFEEKYGIPRESVYKIIKAT